MFSAIFIDHDGTLVDSETAQAKIWQDILSQFKVSFNFSEFVPHIGVPGVKTAAFFVEQYQLPVSAAKLVELKNQHTHKYIKEVGFSLTPGVAELLFKFKRVNPAARIALVSGADRQDILASLKHHPELPLDWVVAGGDCARNKPHPDPYLSALAHFKLSAADCLVIEDSQSGIQSAKDAGLTTYAISHPHTEDAALQRADRVYSTFSQMALELFS